jgi:hypothetical protein
MLTGVADGSFISIQKPPDDRRPEGVKVKEFFKTNEGAADRVLRILAGLVGLSLVFVGPKTSLGLFGLIPLVTGLAGTCPLYSIFGLSTCPKTPGASASR